MNHNLTLTDQKVLEQAQSTLRNHLELRAEGYKCTTEELLNVLLGVAGARGTLESVCGELAGTPEPETIRRYLKEQLCVEQLPALEAALNQALVAELPPRLWRQPREVAIDFHDRPYYGKQTQAEGLWVRSQAKEGTTHFYRMATAYVVQRGLRFTLAIHFVLPEERPVAVLDLLLPRVQALQIQLQRLYLDRGFAGIEVQEYLERCHIPSLIACPIRGKQRGTRALCQGSKSYLTHYTFQAASGHQHTATLAVCRVFTTAKRTQRLRRRAVWQIFILIHLDLSPRQVRRLYRRRFAIETSYRCAGQVRGWTTSPNPVYRFLLMALGVLLVNVWVLCQWLFTQLPRRGGRLLLTSLLPLTRFAHFILLALQRRYGSVHAISAPALPLL